MHEFQMEALPIGNDALVDWKIPSLNLFTYDGQTMANHKFEQFIYLFARTRASQ